MQRDAIRSDRRRSTSLAGALFGGLLERNHRGARLRSIAVAAGFGTYWLALAFFADFPRVLPEDWLNQLVFPINVAADLVTSFFAPRVLLHLLPALFALWLGFRLAAHYLTDLFELEAPTIAANYLRSSVFGLGYDTLNVTQSDLKLLNRSSPLLRIGGPGFLRVHLGHAVVMETADGEPKVYGPERRRFIQGFERMRDVIDLRDQLRELEEVRAVTADGIEVRARDVQMMFRVYGGEQERSLQAPYPYMEAALRRLVYGRPVTEAGAASWTDELADLAKAEIRSFVGSLTLEAFLALQPERTRGEADGSARRSGGEGTRPFHIPRRKLTERFHTEGARSRLRDRGLELDWVGVGTWEIGSPEEGSPISIGKSIISAWQSMQRSRLLKAPSYLTRQRERGFHEGARRPIEGWIGVWESEEFGGRHRCWSLLKHIEHKFSAMVEGLEDEQRAQLPPDLEDALAHLRGLTGSRQLGGPSR